jgi:hypothetical protein
VGTFACCGACSWTAAGTMGEPEQEKNGFHADD